MSWVGMLRYATVSAKVPNSYYDTEEEALEEAERRAKGGDDVVVYRAVARVTARPVVDRLL